MTTEDMNGPLGDNSPENKSMFRDTLYIQNEG